MRPGFGGASLAFREAPSLFQHRRFFSALAFAGIVGSLPASAQQAQTDPSAPASQDAAGAAQVNDPTTPQTQGERARILRDAQTRVNARRRLREQAAEQDTYSHKYEFYAGGSYLRFRPGPSLQHNTEAAWNAGVTEWIRPKLGITGDVRGYYGTAITNSFNFQVFKPSISQYTFMGGPQYRFYQSQHWAWNAQVLAGIDHGNFGTGIGSFTANEVGLYSDGNKLAVSVGAAVDYNLSPALAVRLMPDYLLTNFGSQIQDNLGFTLGVVYRWGRQ